MKVVLFVGLLIIAVLVGLYIKKQSNKGSPDSEFQPSSFPTRWDTLLPGSWKIYTSYTNKDEEWHIDSDVDFLANHGLKLNVSEKYYDIISYSDSRPGRESGGGARGTWHSINDSAFFIKADACDLRTSKEERERYQKKIILTCENFSSGIRFGTIESLYEKTHLTVRNRDTLEIEGKSYSGGYNIYTMFVRIK